MNQSFKGNINTRSLGAWLDDLNELLSLIGQGIPTPNTIVNKIHDIGLNDTILCNFYAFLLRDAKTDITNPSLAIAFMQNVMCLADSNGNIATWPSSNEEKVILRRDKRQLAYNISKASLSKDEIYIISDSGINHEDMIITNAIVLAAKLNLESPNGRNERNNCDFSINSAGIELLQPKKTHGNISLTLPLWVEGMDACGCIGSPDGGKHLRRDCPFKIRSSATNGNKNEILAPIIDESKIIPMTKDEFGNIREWVSGMPHCGCDHTDGGKHLRRECPLKKWENTPMGTKKNTLAPNRTRNSPNEITKNKRINSKAFTTCSNHSSLAESNILLSTSRNSMTGSTHLQQSNDTFRPMNA